MSDVWNRIEITFKAWSPRLVSALLIILTVWMISFLLRRLIQRVGLRLGIHNVILDLLLQVVRLSVWIIGLITAFGTLGVDVTALVAGVGIAGFAVGFALKDVLSNVMSGIMVIYYRPFWIGDLIRVAGQEGQVTDMDLRYTTLDSEDKKILIPNSVLLTNTVEVLSQKPKNDSKSKT